MQESAIIVLVFGLRSILPFAKVFIIELQLENCSYYFLHISMLILIKKQGLSSSSICKYLLRNIHAIKHADFLEKNTIYLQ